MGKYYDTYQVKELPPFPEDDFHAFHKNPWTPDNKRVAWMIYPALKDLELKMVAHNSFYPEAMAGVLIWERTRGKIYTFIIKGKLQYNLGWFNCNFNSTLLKKLHLTQGIIRGLRPMDTWAFVVGDDNGNMWDRDWTNRNTGAPAIGFWANRELAKHFSRYSEENFVGMPNHYGCFLDGSFHHGAWHVKSTMDVMKKRWRTENGRS